MVYTYGEIASWLEQRCLLSVTKTQATSDMSCCKCNRSGRCRNCSCVKSGRTCQGCLPQRLGHCTNVTLPLQRSSPETSTASIADESVAMPPDDVLSQSSDEDEVSCANIDVTWPSPALQPPNLLGAPVVVKSFHKNQPGLRGSGPLATKSFSSAIWISATGKAFVSELARLFQAYADRSSLECIAVGCLVAKWLKRWTADPGVPGSSPTIATGIFFT